MPILMDVENMEAAKTQIGLLLFPDVTLLDLAGPAEVFSANQQCDVHLIWKNLAPVMTGSHWSITPTQTFDTCPRLDIICIPGGAGQIDLMTDEETLDFIRYQADYTSLITSVCTGSLVLGAVGLLQGYRATSHWMSLHQLELLGAIPVKQRVVHDRNRITVAGVSAGIDLALTVVGEFFGEEIAKDIQLSIEYDPVPPHNPSDPEFANPVRINRLESRAQERQVRRLKATRAAASHLRCINSDLTVTSYVC